MDTPSSPKPGTRPNSAASAKSEWNYHPPIPIDNNPLFSWPIRWKDTLTYYRDSWLVLSEGTIFVLLAILSWHLLSPNMETAMSLHWSWVGGIWLRNFLVLLVVAGVLHYYFFARKKQGTDLKYVPSFMSKGSRFLFNNQLLDNMFYALVSGVLIWSCFEVLMVWAMANGYVQMITFQDHPIWFILALPLIYIWIAFHFYCVHRLLHIKFLYDRVHALHHRNIATGPFSGVSMHPVEHLFYFSSVLIHLIVPTHPVHIIFHLYSLSLGAVFGHTGFDALLVKNKKRLAIGHFHHQLHHRYFDCNYGSVDMPWDKWFGTFHDGSPNAMSQIRASRKL